MANVTVSYTIEDAKAQKSVLTLHVVGPFLEEDPGEIPQADGVNRLVYEIAMYLDKVIGGKITNISIAVDVKPTTYFTHTFKAAPEPDSDVEEGLLLTWARNIDGNRFTTQQRLATFKEDYILYPGSDMELGSLEDLYMPDFYHGTDIQILIGLLWHAELETIFAHVTDCRFWDEAEPDLVSARRQWRKRKKS